MAKVYVCDACGQVIEHPHSQKIKEFCLEANCDMGMAFAKPVEKKKEIHLLSVELDKLLAILSLLLLCPLV